MKPAAALPLPLRPLWFRRRGVPGLWHVQAYGIWFGTWASAAAWRPVDDRPQWYLSALDLDAAGPPVLQDFALSDMIDVSDAPPRGPDPACHGADR